MRPLSVIIPTFNESDHMEGVLATVDWVDEVLVIDSFSTDDTLEKAKALGAKVIQRKYTGPADQKNWAIPQAKNEWVLILDADERLTLSLRAEIEQLLSQDKIAFDGFWIGRQNYFMDQKISYSGWQGDAVIRLIRRDACRYNDKQVHEEIISEGVTIGRLKNKMEHYTFKNATHFLDKMRRYGEWSAQDHLKSTARVTNFHLFFKPLFRFFKHYILQRGFMDGRVGLIISIIMAWSVFLRYLYMIERQKKDV
ncbi:MAG: glycosyltransferase family 2 protein [Saprospiraceae bacterium]